MEKINEEEVSVTPEFIHVFDERKRVFVPAWLKMWKRQECVDILLPVTFDNLITSFSSPPVFTAPYSNAHLFLEVTWTLTPTNVQFFLEFSCDSVDWHTHAETPWLSLIYVPAQGNKEECIDATVRAPWLRIRAVATGTTASAKVKVDVKACLNT